MEINGINFTFGADPEVFPSLEDKFVSGHTLIPGTKEDPHSVNKGAVQVDGMALEFNIDPAENFEEFDDNLTSVMDQLCSMIGDHKLLTSSSVVFDEDFIVDIPLYALQLGCDPDFNAYTGMPNERPDASLLMRTAGGHIHVGAKELSSDDPYNPDQIAFGSRLSRLLDETIGLPSLVWDTDDLRRSMYGKSGCFRPKEYGMEYRTLSNRWIFNEKTRKLVFDGVCSALERLFDGNYQPDPLIPAIIDTSDRSSDVFNNNPFVQKAREVLL